MGQLAYSASQQIRFSWTFCGPSACLPGSSRQLVLLALVQIEYSWVRRVLVGFDPPRMTSMRYLSVILLLPFCDQALPAQSGVAAEKQLNSKCAKALVAFARTARSNKVATRAKDSYEEIIASYDPDHASARRMLGFTKTREGWRPPRDVQEWKDEANDRQRFKVNNAWQDTRMKLAGLHRDYGLEIFGEDSERGTLHLLRAIHFDPFDETAHLKLGHTEQSFGEDSYYGTQEQLDFIASLKRLERQALVLARKDYEVQPIEDIPPELAVLEEEFHGSKSEHFKVFTRGTQENADNCVKWSERGLEFLQFALGEDRAKQLNVVGNQSIYDWTAYIWTRKERDLLLAKNLELNPDSALAQALSTTEAKLVEKNFANVQWAENGRRREIQIAFTPAAMHDRQVAKVWELGIGLRGRAGDPNFPLAEGALHAASWLLLSTVMTQRGTLPTGTSAKREARLPKSPGWWLRAMRDQAIARTDLPLLQFPRRQSSAFPNDARLKAWSFMTWLMARHPETWHEFIVTVSGEKIPLPEEIEAASLMTFARESAELEAEWREWASGRSVTAAATGYGPPLLPETPNKEQLAGLRRLNELRAAAGLPPCELDQEATQACVEHARFLLRHPDHWTWPEAHEQDPAKEGFTPRGMRAGMRSVIVIHADDAAKSVDSWFGTVYHRFPLLEQEIGRIGFAFEGDMCVLDMGSLQEPAAIDDKGVFQAKPWVLWPPDEAEDVERQFAFYELPNPLADVPEPNNRDDQAGYPVSLTMPEYIQRVVHEADIRVYIAAKRGRTWERQDEIQVHKHTPGKPLLKRMETPEAIFAIPFEPLARRTSYEVVVTLTSDRGTDTVIWHFTTGAMALRKPNR